MRESLVTGPAIEPVSLAEAKLHARVDIDADDDLITALIVAARQAIEHRLGKCLITQTWDLIIDGFPVAGWGACSFGWGWMGGVRLPRPPVQSVASIIYVGADGVNTTLDTSDYHVLPGTPGIINPSYNISWPTPRSQPGAVTIRYVAGYGDAAEDVPMCVRQAILLMIGHLYIHREAAAEPSVGAGATVMPMGVDYLLEPEKWSVCA